MNNAEFTKQMVEKKLAEIEADERMKYPPANVAINAPLALVQMSLEAWRDSLRWVLKLMEEEQP